MTARSVVVRLDLETAQAIAKSRQFGTEMTRAMDQAESGARRTGAALDDVGARAGRLALGGVAALGSIAAAAVGWESAWTGVTKTVDGTAAEMADLEGGLRDLATSLPATHEEIAGVAEAAGQLGVAREDIVDFTRTMVDLGETTNLTAEDAATSIAQISNVMGTAGEDVDNLGAALVALGNDGASTEAQILGMAQRIAGAGAQIGLAESDILAIANAAASMGIEVEAGGSSISRVFTEMAKATSQGGADLEAFAEVAGMSVQEFSRAFEEDPARAFAAFTTGLDRINQSGGDVFTTLDQLGLADVRVSQALLGMAASGDLLTNSLDLGAEAWADNAALAIEAAKRYDTTASEIQVSWNQIKDAGIEAGEALLPLISEVADVVGTIADAFGKIPEPVQGAFVHMLAIGTLTAGAGWLGLTTISKISNTRAALADLETQSPRTAGAIRGISRAAGVAAIALGGLEVATALTTTSDPVAGMEETTRAILDLAESAGGAESAVDSLFERETTALGGPAQMRSEITGLKNALDELQTGGFEKLLSDPIFIDSSWDLATQSIEKLDEAMVNLVQTGNADAAASMFEYFAEVASEAGYSAEEAADLLPGYADALVGLENKARASAEAQVEVADGARTAANGITYSAEQIEAAQEAYEEQVENATDVARAFFGIGDAVNKTKVSLGGWIKSLEEQADALRNFRINSERAAEKGLRQGLIAALQEAGPEGALRMRQLANATDAEIGRANRAWQRGQREIGLYVDATTKVPEMLVTRVDVEAQAAFAELYRLRDLKLGDKTITIHTVRAGGGDLEYLSGGAKADGGTVPGRLLPYGDRTLILAAPGEEVISNRHGQADRHRPLLKAINAGRFADGGTVMGGPTGRWRQDRGTTVERTVIERVVERLPDSFTIRADVEGMGEVMFRVADARMGDYGAHANDRAATIYGGAGND